MKLIFTILLTVFSLFFAAAQIPVNDDCSGIIDLGIIPFCSQPAQFTNLNATTSNIDATANVPSCWNNLADRDVWFQFSLPNDGSILDVSIQVLGDIDGNGTLKMPQLALYRGDCSFGGLAELLCVAAELNVNELQLDAFGLLPGIPYFLRINDYSASASANAGSFKLCIEAYVPENILGQTAGSSSCTGTLWDSGGPDGDYSSNENLSFVICPTEFHQCIKLNFASFATEFEYDFIRIYEGDGTSGTLVEVLEGVGVNEVVQVSSNCLTLQFTSDGSVQEAGFEMTWECSTDVCDAEDPTLPSNASCDQALNINGCGNSPQIIPLSPGSGDPNFIQQGVNQGCFEIASFDFNFSFFYFEAQADGKFGFTVQSANPLEATDIDFNVWGPINSVADICNFVSNNQPIRSSWDEGDDLTGLADVHPVFGTPVNDNFDCGSPSTPGTDPPFGAPADDFVRRIDVLTGQIYVVLLDDFDGNIQENGIAIDFSGTSDGVLGLLAPPITVSNDTFSCDGSPVQLFATGGINYAWTPSAGLSCNTCPNPFVSPSVPTTYIVKVVDVCQSLIDSITVSVKPTVLVQGDTAICNGQSVVLGRMTPQTDVIYSWTPNDGSLSDPSAANPVATPLQNTVYTLTASSGPCVETRTVTVSVVNLDLDLSVQDTSICRGQSVEIFATTSPTVFVSWSPLTQLQLQPGGVSAKATPNNSIVYNLTASLPGCVRKAAVSIQVDSLPNNLNLAPADTAVCAGQQVLLVSPSYTGQNFPGLQFIWQTNTGQTLPENEYFLLAEPSETTVYQRITSNGACVDTASSTINVIPVPALTISPAQPQLCTNESTPLVVNNTVGLSDFQWSPSIGLSCVNCINPTASPSTTTTYEFTANATNGCTASASVTVEVNQPPVVQFPANNILCSGDSLQLNLLVDSTVTYTWTSNPPGFTSSEAQPMVAPTQNTTYLLNLENGCTVQAQFAVQVVPPGVLTVSNDATVCAGVSAPLTASGNFPGNYVWSNGATGQVISVQPAQATTYFVTYNYPLPSLACQIVDSVTISVQGGVGQVLFPSDTLLCPGEGIQLNSIATPGATYSWTSNPMIFSSQAAIPDVFFPEESATYFVTTNLDNCVVTYEVEVKVFNPMMMVTEDFSICAGELFTISADAFLTGDYLWTPGGTTPTFMDTATISTQYALQFEYGDGCVLQDTVNVTVVPNFMLRIVSDPDTNRVNIGEPILLDGFVQGQNVSNYTFTWLENNTTPVGNTQQVTVTPNTTENTITYSVTVVSPAGCVQTESITFAIIPSNVKVPNAFTPNGDGANDSFGLAIAEGVGNVQTMEVYSRWGQKVFSSNEPNARWDGTVGGQPAPSDVYVYVIYWRGGDGALMLEKGEVTLLR
jgi:gliding motility-associated-like protein